MECTDARGRPVRHGRGMTTSVDEIGVAEAVVMPVVGPRLPEAVRSWRREVLERAGYPGYASYALSRYADVDLHQAVRLLETGCPVPTALRILL